MPDYTIIWKDEWCNLFDINDKNPIQDGINKILSLQKMTPITTTDSKTLFSILPSSYYWIITLLSLIKMYPDQSDLFYYLKNPGLDVESCKDKCFNACSNIYDQYFMECEASDCTDENAGSCDIRCASDSQSYKNYYCAQNKDLDYYTFNGNRIDSVNKCIKKNCE
jgi:hypothetical protein